MKKLLLFVVGGFMSMTSFGQLPDGSAAPDFTVTDIDGNTHSLSDYMTAGKTVIMDISATWCGPCWSYHNAHVLADMHNAYGPDGSDEIVVIFIEGDASTTLADLNGTGGSTQGDWVTGTPYPIVDGSDGAGIASSYSIAYYPTVYTICPDGAGGGTVYESGTVSASGHTTFMNDNCGTISGASDHSNIDDAEISICETTGAPEFEISNYGTNAITAATVKLFEGGTEVASTDYSGSIAQFESAIVTFPSMTLNPASTYTAEVTAVNGSAPFNPALNTASYDVELVVDIATSPVVTVEIVTDAYGSETTWELKDGAGTTLASGGPYGDLTAVGTTVQTPVEVSIASDDCLEMVVYDSYGDGMDTYGAGSYAVKNSDGSVIVSGGSFGSVDKAHFKSNTFASVDQNEIKNVSVYPNPVNTELNINFNGVGFDYTLTLTDLQGRVVYSENLGSVEGYYTSILDLSGYSEGMYLLNISSEKTSHIERIVKK